MYEKDHNLGYTVYLMYWLLVGTLRLSFEYVRINSCLLIKTFCAYIRHVYMYRCIQLDALEDSTCNGVFQGLHNVIYNYTTQENFYNYIEATDSSPSLLRDAFEEEKEEEELCQYAFTYIICNYVFIPCNLTTGYPRPICTKSFDHYVNRLCAYTFQYFLRFASTIHYPFTNDSNTLAHLETFGYSLSSDSFADGCIDIAGTYVHCGYCVTIIICYNNTAILEPGLILTNKEGESGGSNDMTSGDSSSSGIVIAASVVGSLLALVIVFLVVLLLLIRHKCKARKYKYKTLPMTPAKVLYNHSGYVPSPSCTVCT